MSVRVGEDVEEDGLSGSVFKRRSMAVRNSSTRSEPIPNTKRPRAVLAHAYACEIKKDLIDMIDEEECERGKSFH